MSNPPSDKTSDKRQSQRPERPPSAAQRASEANRAQQAAVRAQTARPADRRTPVEGETSNAGLENDNRPVGVNKR